MTVSARIRVLLATAALSAAVAGCGGGDDVGDPIPRAKAAELEAQLDALRDAVAQGLCEDAETAVNEARVTVDTLDDDGVGSDVQDALGDGVDNLGSLVSQQCEEEEVETTPETTPETIPEPEPTTPEPEPTTPEPEPEPTTPLPEPEPEPDEDDGGAQFDPDAEIPPGQQKKSEGED
jgi:outer membrane biosynthesis protein TonB